MSDDRPTLPEGLALVGALAAAVGTYLPWIVTAPDAEMVPQVYLSGMETGIASQDYLVLGLLVVGLAAAASYRHERRGGYVAAGTGAGVVALTVYYVATTLGGFFGSFVPGAGVYLTVAGGLLLAVAGWRHLATEPWVSDGVGVPG